MALPDFANPPLAVVLAAVPRLMWRLCYHCGSIALYIDATIPECTCRDCGSNDTRLMKQETKALRGDK